MLKLSNYGFTKLINLFNAIPDTVEVTEREIVERSIKLKTYPQIRRKSSPTQFVFFQKRFELKM